MDANVTFAIRESAEKTGTFYEVWRRNHAHGTECLLAEADNRADARELVRHYASLEKDKKEVSDGLYTRPLVSQRRLHRS